MAHRRLLVQGESFRPLAGSDLFAQIGGRETVEALIDGLYDRIEADSALRPLFGHNLIHERAGQTRFFMEWLGGGATYSETAYMPLKHRHDLLPITQALAEKWLEHFRASLECAVADAGARDAIYAGVQGLATALVNSGAQAASIRAASHGTCLRYKPAITSLGLASRGETPALRELLRAAPDVLASELHAAQLLHLAALNGRVAVVELLLELGVDVNAPSPIEALIMVTPLCAARLRRRKDVEALLLERGAVDDVFSNAFLGDVSALRVDLERDPSLAQISDPAVDALEITPVHHAVAGGHVEALRLLLARGVGPVLNPTRALRHAVARENVAMVRLLLDRGADASSIGAGRWVCHADLAPLLSRAGARVDRSGGWIGLACTGNQGRKDDPEFVAALLQHGARADDRRLVGQDNDGGRATALHYAAKAGFLGTIRVLLADGADPSAKDDNGLTPLDWLERSAKSVDRTKVRELLQRGT
ncbi:MAG: ankyrin repeat domain-containing protein [Chloroflexi bacterium]|nr:ankyrin repeat domain-containing protein [Chloroflexota bacterium]